MPIDIEAKKRLFEIARLQEGLFTAKQAQSAGFLPKNFSGHVQRGNWIKIQRGLYKISEFNINEVNFELTKWHLWSRDINDTPQAVFSHLTALSIHDIGNDLPTKIHMTVPKKFRKMNELPKILKVYFEDLKNEDFHWVNSYRVTTIFKTLMDLKTSTLYSGETFEYAFEDAIKNSKLTKQEIKTLSLL